MAKPAKKAAKKAAATPAAANAAAKDTRHTIFLIHGIGQYGKYETVDGKKIYKIATDGWFAKAEKELATIHDTIIAPACGINTKFAEDYRVVPVEYDSIFERFRLDWAYQAGQWEKLMGDLTNIEAKSSWITSLQEFLKGAGSDDFGWTHIADVLMYCLPTVRGHIANHVAAQIAGDLASTSALGKWSMIAHSLGTAVMHDTYPNMIETIGADRNKLSGPQVVCSVSNFAQLLTDHRPDPYHRFISPLASQNEPRPLRYIECRHKLDFLAHVDPFDPPNWTSANDYHYSALTELNEFYWKLDASDWEGAAKQAAILPHDFWHYMRQPDVAAELWGSLTGNRLKRSAIHTAMTKEMQSFNDEAEQKALGGFVDKALENLKPRPNDQISPGLILKPDVVIATIIDYLARV